MSAVVTWAAANSARLVEELARVRGDVESPRGRGARDVHGGDLVDAMDTHRPDPTHAAHTPHADLPDRQRSSTLDELCTLFVLSPFERDVLLLCAGVELDGDFAAAVARVQDGPPLPTFSLALGCLGDAHWSALTPQAPLRAWRLIELLSPDLTGAPLRIDERILHFLVGVECTDERLLPLLRAPAEGTTIGPFAPELRALASRLEGASGGELLQLTGADAITRRCIAAAACRTAGAAPLVFHSADIPAAAADRYLLARALSREMLLSGSLLLLDAAPEMDRDRIARFVGDLHVPLVLLAEHPWREMGERPTLVIEVHRPARQERLALLGDALRPYPSDIDAELQEVAAQFDLDGAAVRRVAARVHAGRAGEGSSGADAASFAAIGAPAGVPAYGAVLWDAARVESRPRLDAVAQRSTSVATWDDLVLPEAQHATLRAIARDVRYRHRVYEDWGFAAQGSRGLGISVLFAGASGTGKTLAAEVLANELRLDLYRVDLAGVVSKYIGETEKNLAQLFDRAEGTGVVLLFDEADALFGKRSEVRDSHDRYANIEVSYLLQRMEAYRGLAILTTNQKTALDPAFTRRLRYIVTFPFPDRDARAEIWRRSFPRQTPTADLDPSRLAQLNLAGGHIRNIALAGAFLAAERNQPVTMADLATAARAEYAKLERPLADAELRGW